MNALCFELSTQLGIIDS